MLKVDPKDRELLIAPLYRASLTYRTIVLGLAAIVAWGGYTYVRQVITGLGVTNLNRPVFWGVYMVNFIFLIGVSMAGTLISAALYLTGANWRRPITRIAETLTVFGLIIAAMQILFDMGRPERMLSVVLQGRLQSPLLWDMTSLTVYILSSMGALYLQLLPDIALLRDNMPEGAPQWRRHFYTWLALGWRGNREQWIRFEKVLTVVSILIIPIGVSLHTVTSWIFSTTVQPGWKSTILGPYFVIGAVFSGIGVLVIVISFFRVRMGLQRYFQHVQYRNLNLLFIVMSVTWFYFTYTEHLTLVAEQETMEFPLLASKLWGEFAGTFWGMVILMVVAFWLIAVPLILPRGLMKLAAFRPRLLLPQFAAAAIMLVLLIAPEWMPVSVSLARPMQLGAWLLFALLLISAALGLALWLKDHLIVAMVTASVCVVLGMWLERWNIIVPTVTHPRLIPYTTYLPSMTEVSITIASFALLALLPILFFKLFPVISIWEVAEGRVMDEAQSKIEIPLPESSAPPRRRWKSTRRSLG